MDKTIYRLPEIKKIIEEQKYKFCSLFDMDGNTLVTYNSIKGGRKSLQDKLEEIQTRCKRLTPGVYILVCKAVYGSSSKGDKFYLGVGDFDPTIINDAPAFPDKKTLSDPDTKPGKRSAEHLLSVDSAMEHMREIAELKSEIARLTAENERLLEEIADLEEEEPMNEGMNANGLSETIKNILPMLDPLADKYFSLEEKKLNFQQTKFLHEKGYVIPGLKKANGSSPKRSENKPREIPQPGSKDWPEYIEALLQMEEEAFNSHMEQLQANAPEIYEAACAEVYTEGEEES